MQAILETKIWNFGSYLKICGFKTKYISGHTSYTEYSTYFILPVSAFFPSYGEDTSITC